MLSGPPETAIEMLLGSGLRILIMVYCTLDLRKLHAQEGNNQQHRLKERRFELLCCWLLVNGGTGRTRTVDQGIMSATL